MLDAHSVITHATHRIVHKLAAEYEVSLPRMYEMLGDQCVYPKAKRLIRKIARNNIDGARLIKADLDSMFEDILHAEPCDELTAADLHREAFEAVHAVLENKSTADKKQELRELICISQKFLESLDKDATLKAVEVNGNGNARKAEARR